VLKALSDGNVLKKGDVLRIFTGGGGGNGHPFDRPEADVLRDVADGFVSVEAAAREYGVLIRDGAVNAAATAALRAKRPAAAAFHRVEYVDAIV
jgi:N-methylhydantoinase B